MSQQPAAALCGGVKEEAEPLMGGGWESPEEDFLPTLDFLLATGGSTVGCRVHRHTSSTLANSDYNRHCGL
jgi:hypothetical protein